MKKILTFLMMFAMTAGILSAQTPNLSYQVVVRDANNNLVVNQKVNVEVVIMANLQDSQEMVDVPSDFQEGFRYEEFIQDSTNANGMLSLTIGQDGDNPFLMMDWSTAVISMVISNQENESEVFMTLEEPVYAVPYALQAGFLLTTDQIVNYLMSENGEVQDAEDVNEVLAALRNNENHVLDTIVKVVVEYVKSRFDIAKRIGYYYMENKLTGSDVRNGYDSLLSNQDAMDAVVAYVDTFFVNHRDLFIKIAKKYLGTNGITGNDVQALFDELYNNTPVYEFVKAELDTVLDKYVSEHNLDPSCLKEKGYNNLCDLANAAQALASNPNDTCPRITNFTHTANDGLVVLGLNKSIIMTAYMKNYDESKVSNVYMTIQTVAPDGTVMNRPMNTLHYTSLNNNFGKWVDSMAETNLCGDSLRAIVYLELNTEHPCAASSDNVVLTDTISYRVPGYSIVLHQTVEQDNPVVKAIFDPEEAQQVFDSYKRDNVSWYVDDHIVSGAHGTTYSVNPEDMGKKIKAKAQLGSCIVWSEEITIQ